jgi:hypothetical protein
VAKTKAASRDGTPTRAPWMTAGQIQNDVAFWWQHAIYAHPTLQHEIDGVWLRAQSLWLDGAGAFIQDQFVRAQTWLRTRYPNIWRYPTHLNSELVYSVLSQVMRGGQWDEAGRLIADKVGQHVRDLKVPVRGEAWVAIRTMVGAPGTLYCPPTSGEKPLYQSIRNR